MKKISLFLIFSFFLCSLAAQDIIYKMDDSKIAAKVLEITPDVIKYKKHDFLDGPIYNLPIAELHKIVYENGKTEIFRELPTPEITPEKPVAKPKPSTGPPLIGKIESSKKVKTTKDFKSSFSIGFTVGGNVATGIYDYKTGTNPPVESFRVGPAGGIILNYHFAKWLAVHTNILYKAKGDRIDMDLWASEFEFPPGISVTTTAEGDGFITNYIGYLEFSLVPTFVLNPNSRVQVLLGVGPYGGIGLHGHEKQDYTIYYYYNGVFEEEKSVNLERDIEFVNLLQESDNPDLKYVNRFDYGVYFNTGVQFDAYLAGVSVSWGRAELEPDMEGFFGAGPRNTITKNISGSIYFCYFFREVKHLFYNQVLTPQQAGGDSTPQRT